MNGTEFRITRIALGLSQAKMAAFVGKGTRTVKQYESRDYQPPEAVVTATADAFESMTEKLEPFMALRAGSAERTLWAYATEEELHAAQPEFADWNIDTYNEYLSHAIVILKLRGVGYRVLSPTADK